MFGLSIFELLFIFVIALIVFGPEKLPEFARGLGKLTGELKKNTDALRKEFYNSIYPPASQLHSNIRNLKSEPLKSLNKTLEELKDLTPNTDASSSTTCDSNKDSNKQ